MFWTGCRNSRLWAGPPGKPGGLTLLAFRLLAEWMCVLWLLWDQMDISLSSSCIKNSSRCSYCPPRTCMGNRGEEVISGLCEVSVVPSDVFRSSSAGTWLVWEQLLCNRREEGCLRCSEQTTNGKGGTSPFLFLYPMILNCLYFTLFLCLTFII